MHGQRFLPHHNAHSFKARCFGAALDTEGLSLMFRIWPWAKIQIVPPVQIPIPTKIGSKMGGEFTYQPKGDPNTVLTTTAIWKALGENGISSWNLGPRTFLRLWEGCTQDELAVVVKAVLGSHVGWVNSPPMLEPIFAGIGMFAGGTIWILAHGHFVPKPQVPNIDIKSWGRIQAADGGWSTPFV